MAYFDDAIEGMGCQKTVISASRRRELMQEWRSIYASWLHAISGKWVHKEYDWHVFSYRHARAYSGERAWIPYQMHHPSRFVICPHDNRLPAYEVTDGALPDFRNSGVDLYVWPDGLEWTMAFTHEDGWFGPYYSRREWIIIPDRRNPGTTEGRAWRLGSR